MLLSKNPISLLALIISLSLPAPLLAAPSDTDLKTQEEFLRQQEQRLAAKQAQEDSQKRSQQPMTRLGKEKKTLAKITLPQETPSFLIRKIYLRGPRHRQFSWIARYLQQYENQAIGLQGINLLVKTVNEALVDRGYITSRIYVREQDIAAGILFFDLAPGTVGHIRFAESDTWGTWKNAFPLRSGDLLNIRDLEQGLEQMRRPSSQDADIQIQPSDTPGQSDILITVQRKKNWQILTTLDDSGAKSTGQLQASLSFGLDNLLSANDILTLSFNQDAENQGEKRGTRSNSLSYSIPFGRQTLSFSQSDNTYHQTVATALEPFQYSGESQEQQLILTQLLHRDQSRKTNLELAVIHKQRRSYIQDAEITVQRQDTTAARIGLTHRQYFGQTVLDTALRYQKGVPWGDARPGVTDDQPGQATTLYDLYSLDLNLDMPASFVPIPNSRYSLHLRGQTTNDLLYGSELFSIGGRYTVRGFDGEQTLSAESGFFIRNEIQIPLNKTNQLYTALDYGRITGPSTQYLLGKQLWGSAVGFRGAMKHIPLQYDAFIGWPLNKPEGFETADQTYGFQLLLQL
ncbi:polypeptide-transport-associated domain-containing protein [Acetonema longum DSM 6540]|uniref:Polypeptide-transport-associated domain-containing protein n=2 Tax=Acetonema TaxID=2373 RepID=F7NFT1_9FIRM|nr:polypeptide-transport-associated domain-containing protein [Acetonema longum DSM 6540]